MYVPWQNSFEGKIFHQVRIESVSKSHDLKGVIV
ncbi:MAG: hypothetical protein ACK4TN_06350 [Brevinematales bacterium]